MGGIGSGSWIRCDTRRTTDQFLTLNTNRLVKDNLIRPGIRSVLNWTNETTGEHVASVAFNVHSDEDRERIVEISYRWNDSEDILTPLRLQKTELHFGGCRWWFLCPLRSHSGACNRRVNFLYLRDRYFGCRSCHQLTYRSSQEQRTLKKMADHINFATAMVRLNGL